MADLVAGQTVHLNPRYNAGFIFLSYLVSLVGCVTTLELLHRRTSRRGAANWYLLVTSSITMGGIGIWCMHFIGNRAIQLDNINGQIFYSPTFTAVSFFLPIAVLLAAFYLLAVTDKTNPYFIGTSGFLTGTAVCGMHYVGQLGIVNYTCSYQPGNVVGAAVIAISASLVALTVFFRLQETWTNNWWKRTICGTILAGAVSGMHWTATVGTSYQPKANVDPRSSPMSRTQTVIVCTVLALASCVLLLMIAFVANKTQQQSKRRVGQLVLASAYFDDAGRIMVTAQGFLPAQCITNSYVDKTFGDDELNKTHPAFIWAFRASRNWKALKDLVPGMRHHLESDFVARHYIPGGTPPHEEDSALAGNFATIFKELFCVAAENLADRLHQPLDQLGVLFEEPVSTGTVSTKSFIHELGGPSMPIPVMQGEDVEKNGTASLSGRGRFLFLIRQLTKPEVENLAAQGYRFATIPQIATFLSRSMQIKCSDVSIHLERMRSYSTTEKLLAPGIYLAGFVLRPSLNRGFDILVPSPMQNQLPTVALPYTTLADWQMRILQEFDGCKVEEILQSLQTKEEAFENVQEFQLQLYLAITRLTRQIGDRSFAAQAKFSSQPIQAPCQQTSKSTETGRCTLFSFRLIADLHARPANSRLTYVPLRFFNTQQQISAGGLSREVFSREAKVEFAHCRNTPLQDLHRKRTESRRPSTKYSTLSMRSNFATLQSPPSSPTTPRSAVSFWGGNSLLRRGNEKKTQSAREAEVATSQPATLEERPSVESHETLHGDNDSAISLTTLQVSTFVDELYGLFLAERVDSS